GVLFAYTGFLFALKASDQLSRVRVFASFFSSAAFVLGGRVALSRFLIHSARARRIGHRIVVLGGGERGQQLIEYLRSRNDPMTHIVGVFDDRSDRVPREVSGVPVLGGLRELSDFVRNNPCDEVLVALPGSAHERIMQIVNELRVLPLHVSLCPDFAGLKFLPTSYRDCSGVPVLAMARKPFTHMQALVKRIEDLVLGSLITLLVLPVMAVIAVLIKLDSRGPVLFKQPRYGFNNKLINVYKFRTMYTDRTDAAGAQLTQRNDPRITRIGRFLRRSSLDELPQFFNVLKGEMSIVGPRPHAVQAKAGSKLYEDVVTAYASRHRVKPGITGWAQVNGWRGETNTDEQILQRVNHDLHYIDNWSVLQDLWIILRTVFAVATTDKAF
ncbi:MAG: undecaprenyl-phosphate glucose phosphotransferase, partial [Pseudomonadota bacterium]